jgi:hypothetical protein
MRTSERLASKAWMRREGEGVRTYLLDHGQELACWLEQDSFGLREGQKV